MVLARKPLLAANLPSHRLLPIVLRHGTHKQWVQKPYRAAGYKISSMKTIIDVCVCVCVHVHISMHACVCDRVLWVYVVQ